MSKERTEGQEYRSHAEQVLLRAVLPIIRDANSYACLDVAVRIRIAQLVLPGCALETDNDGQYLIYTGLFKEDTAAGADEQ